MGISTNWNFQIKSYKVEKQFNWWCWW